VECDFVESSTKVIAHMDLTITLGRLLAAVFKFLFKALIKFLQIMKKRKGGAKNEPDVT
jgi:large-conductance mechanosensitive channel